MVLRILVLLVSFCAVALAEVPTWLPSEDVDSFSLETSITGNYNNGFNLRSHFREHFSNSQKRSKIEYEITSGSLRKFSLLPDRGAFYSDGSNIILFDAIERTCSASSLRDIDTLSGLDVLGPDSGERYGSSSVELLGPAKLLSFLHDHRGKMERKDTPSTFKAHNIPAKVYRLEVPVANSEFDKVSFSIVYDRDSEGGVPLQVVAFNAKVALITFDFGIPSQVSKVASGEIPEFSAILSQEPQLDEFAIPRGLGCSRALEVTADSLKLPIGNNQLATSFSFSAILSFLTEPKTKPTTFHVAFEPSLATLRVDRVQQTKSTITLTNYETNRNYHVVQRFPTANKDSSNKKNEDLLDYALDTDLNEDAARTGTMSCVIFEAPTVGDKPDSARNGAPEVGLPSLLTLLFGDGLFKSLGRAKVRGLSVNVFEAHDSSWPLWLRQPMLYEKRSAAGTQSQTITRPTGGRGGHEFMLNTVVYLTDPPQTEGGDQHATESKLLLVEVFLVHRETMRVEEKTTLQVVDFNWKIESSFGEDLRPEDLFSLADECPASAAGADGNNHYGELSVLLASPKPVSKSDADWLQVGSSRNLAVLSGLHKSLKVPATSLYDVESSLKLDPIKVGGLDVESAHLYVKASLKVAEHRQLLSKLVFLGFGKKTRVSRRGPVKRLQFRSTFQACAFLAAHNKVSVMFGFSPKEEYCFIDFRPLEDKELVAISNGGKNFVSFELDESGPLEVYMIRHERELGGGYDYGRNDALYKLVYGRQRNQLLNYQTKTVLVDPNWPTKNLEFVFKSIHVNELNEKDWYRLNREQVYGTNKLDGFGLLESDDRNRRLLPEHLSGDLHSMQVATGSGDNSGELEVEMTIGQCQAACLADLYCSSFSLCVRDAHFDCILSSVSFRGPNVVLQLLRASQSVKRIETITIGLEDGQPSIELVKKPTCVLHNKVYLEMFDRPAKQNVAFSRGQVQLVLSREHCAQICVEKTISETRKGTGQAEQVGAIPTARKRSITEHRDFWRRFCGKFFYLDELDFAALEKEAQEEIMAQVTNKEFFGSTSGYCVVGELYANEDAKGRDKKEGDVLKGTQQTRVPVSQYMFRFELMYEKQFGIALLESKRNAKQQAAYVKLLYDLDSLDGSGGGNQEDAARVMKEFLELGENSQMVRFGDESRCALMCFANFANLWPGCKSFDLIVLDTTKSLRVVCHFNSVTLRQTLKAERFDLIETNAAKLNAIKVWHYEPKAGFVLDEANIESKLEFGNSQLFEKRKQEIHLFGVFLLVLVALLVGSAGGTCLAATYSRRVARHFGHEDEDTLVEPRQAAQIQFSNLVNHEGVVCSREEQPDEELS